MVLNHDSTYGSKETESLLFHVGFEGSLGSHEVTPRGLLSSVLGSLVSVHGILTKCTAVRPKVVKSVHYCPATNLMSSKEYRDATSLGGLPTPSVYPTQDESGNVLETEFGLSVYKDYQQLTVQETPESAPLGQLPRSVDIVVENDLVDKCKPGDRVQIVGVYRALATKSAASTAIFQTALLANNVQVRGKDAGGIVMTMEDLAQVRELSKRADIFDILGRSVAPSIFGHERIKQALLLQLLGGVEKNLANGTHLRGDINLLLVGDPSTAKSQMLRFVRRLAPLAVHTTGRGSSGVGLTAAVTRDPDTKERRLEAGAMVLADRGIVCIDEFDKMSEADRVAIHEVMEQQTVTIAKAGIHATLNARCSVLAAANPVYGQYNKNKKPQENIGLPDSLLSRFDLLFVVLDKLDRKMDRQISEHVLRMHRYFLPGQEGIPLATTSSCLEPEVAAEVEKEPVWQKYNPLLHGDHRDHTEVLTMSFLKKYVYYAKTRFTPKLTDAAIETISQGYAELRAAQTEKTLPVTARSLEMLIRLSSAHAKACMRSEILQVDAEKSLELAKFALYHDTKVESYTEPTPSETDDEPSLPEIPVPRKATPKSTLKNVKVEDRILTLLAEYMASVSDENIIGTPFATLLSQLDGYGLNKTSLYAVIESMETDNRIIYERNDETVCLL